MDPWDVLVVLDDDPTGTQLTAGVPVLLHWTPATIAAHAEAGAVHLMTNTRALAPDAARRTVAGAARAARDRRSTGRS